MNKDSLGDRIKRYESVSNNKLLTRTPLIIRVDGKAFHTFTRGSEKPFDRTIINAMTYATVKTAEDMQGFKLAYVQSDEATFMLWDFDTLETSAWFNYEINKVVSITASMFTAHFNYFWQNRFSNNPLDDNFKEGGVPLALFDARAFNVPLDDWQNVFIWRQRDWERNSIQMLARSLYSQKELHGKKVTDIHELLHKKGVNWESLDPQLKNGTFVNENAALYFGKITYDTISSLLTMWHETKN